ncbi:hypothetical protein ZWY2020_027838 [Hordeum vulgare]|nr:hypothetical protein ZWY2020_027838 [Hordeum vulgare]
MGKYSDGDACGGGSHPLVAVCIDKDKNSQNALKYATETLVHRGQAIVLVHVNTCGSSGGGGRRRVQAAGGPGDEGPLPPFRCFCTRKDIQCKDVVLDDHDVAKSSSSSPPTPPSTASSSAPTPAAASSASRPTSPTASARPPPTSPASTSSTRAARSPPSARPSAPPLRLPARTMIQGAAAKPPGAAAAGGGACACAWRRRRLLLRRRELTLPARPRCSRQTTSSCVPDFSLPESSDISFIGAPVQRRSGPASSYPPRLSTGTACKEALTAKQKATELQRWKEEEQRSHDGRLTEEMALALIEQEKAKARAAIEAAEASQRLAELEAQKRIAAERKALKEGAGGSSARYRRYSIEEIEAGTEHFSDALKVLRPDAAEGKAQFQQEVEVLSCIRHPNMVLLLGACPEYGCLVYEYMAMGSLDDCLFRRGGVGPVLPWQHRFRIAAEIATGLLFLHQAKPEPLVHRDLKPGNILLTATT